MLESQHHVSLNNVESSYQSDPDLSICSIQIVFITRFIIKAGVCIKRIDCISASLERLS